MKPSPSQLAILRPDFSATAELTWPELGTLGESEERAPGALKHAPAGRRTLGAPGLRQSAASCGRSAQHRPRLGGRACCPPRRRRWRERSPPTLAFPPRQPDRSAKGSSTLSLRTAPVPEKWKEGDVFVVTLPQILTQVHKAHDHVCVVEGGAVRLHVPNVKKTISLIIVSLQVWVAEERVILAWVPKQFLRKVHIMILLFSLFYLYLLVFVFLVSLFANPGTLE